MADAYFHLRERLGASATFRSDPATGGPWAAHLQHGGPPTALLVAETERTAAGETGRPDLVAMRVAAEFVGPVPVDDITVTTRVVRAARAAALVEAILRSGSRDCLQARVWLIARTDTSSLAPQAIVTDDVAGPEGRAMRAEFPYGESIDWRLVSGAGLHGPGPSAVWARPKRPVLAGTPLSSLQRAALVGDSASGISAELDWSTWSFANIDLDVHLARPVVGDWLLMDAVTQLGAQGAALARSALSDLAGPVGTTAQTLVVRPHE